MKAIVLTCDKNRLLTDHMILKYRQLWPDHPFVFRVPYQELLPALLLPKVEFKRSPVEIKATVLTLLDDLADEEMIYWCIDDKYPIRLDLEKIRQIYGWLTRDSEIASAISGVLFCRCRKMLCPEYLTGQIARDAMGTVYLERKGYEQIWIHQFLRVKVLRSLFEFFPDEIPYPRLMDELKERFTKPGSHHIYVCDRNLAVFGESTSFGALTLNCYRSIQENGLALPDWTGVAPDEEIVMGEL